MIERIQSPGVYSYENDQSFIQTGVSPSGIAIVGPTEKGPAYIPTDVYSYSEFTAKFGNNGKETYVNQSVLSYLNAGESAKVIRVLGNGGWTFNGSTRRLAAIVSGSIVLTVFHPSKNENADTVSLNSSSATGTLNAFNLTLSGSSVYKQTSASLNSSDSRYILNVLGTDANFQTGSAFAYLHFANFVSSSVSLSASSSLVTSSTAVTFTSSYAEGYDAGKTPWIISEGGIRLFRFVHTGHGDKTNKDVKIAIAGITKSNDPDTFTTLSVIVRAWNDTDSSPSILEQYNNVSLDADASNYIGRIIGDKYSEYDSNISTVVEKGDYNQISKYIRVELSDAVKARSINYTVGIGGFEAYYETIAGFGSNRLPAVSYVSSNTGSNTYSGFDFSKSDNLNYLNPVPLEAVTGSNTNFSLPTNDDKFVLGLQGGLDGMSFSTIRKIGSEIKTDGTNVFGFDLSSSSTGGTAAYRKALNILSNKQDFQFELLTLPGILDQYHSSVTTLADNMAVERADTFYIRDLVGLNASVQTAVNQTAGLDSNYSAVYFPWVRVRDINTNKIISVPPSVVVPQAYAYNDRVSAAWYAPAGVSRGGLGGVVDVYAKINKADQGSLYDARINPIIRNTSGGGVVIYGQKTLQVKSTALDRINVRRLLIELKIVIGNMATALVFEPNNNATRNSFLAKVNPYLDSVQQRNGLYGYRVVMDDSNNTSDVIDRYELRGTVYIYPVRAAEFVILEFNIQPTGATFS